MKKGDVVINDSGNMHTIAHVDNDGNVYVIFFKQLNKLNKKQWSVIDYEEAVKHVEVFTEIIDDECDITC
jgi:hypothetical protein